MSDNLEVEFSFMRKGNTYEVGLSPETKASFGAAYRKGMWTVFGEIVNILPA